MVSKDGYETIFDAHEYRWYQNDHGQIQIFPRMSAGNERTIETFSEGYWRRVDMREVRAVNAVG